MKKQIFIGVIVLSLIIPILSSAKADVAQTENKGIKIEKILWKGYELELLPQRHQHLGKKWSNIM